MRAHHDGIARFECNQDFKNSGGSGVGGGNNGSDDAHRHGNLYDAGLFIFADDADSFHVFNGMVNVSRAEEIFFNLIGNYAVGGLLHRHACQRLSMLARRGSTGRHHCINLFLGKVFENFLGLRRLFD